MHPSYKKSSILLLASFIISRSGYPAGYQTTKYLASPYRIPIQIPLPTNPLSRLSDFKELAGYRGTEYPASPDPIRSRSLTFR